MLCTGPVPLPSESTFNPFWFSSPLLSIISFCFLSSVLSDPWWLVYHVSHISYTVLYFIHFSFTHFILFTVFFILTICFKKYIPLCLVITVTLLCIINLTHLWLQTPKFFPTFKYPFIYLHGSKTQDEWQAVGKW